MGVRKAQVKLAAYYLSQGDEEKARLICADVEGEPSDRLLQIRKQLEGVTSKDFWEIIDRGTNFDYLEPSRKARLDDFFSWFRTTGV